MKIMTFNIKFAFQTTDPILAWAHRKEGIFQTVEEKKPDFVGFQEVQKEQLADLKAALPQYEFFGQVRSEEVGSEYNPIAYLKEKFELLDHATFWLSDTPEKMSKTPSWQAGCYRIATWGTFREKDTGKEFLYINTHFDHESPVARKKGALVLQEFMKDKKLPIFLTGDFNGEAEEAFYQVLTKTLQDSVAVSENHTGPLKTCSMMEVGDPYVEDVMSHIDYVFSTPTVKVVETETFVNDFNGEIPSDHYPVIATFDF